ncbi:MAG: SurA N-terminal domain-containing protein [Deltaproteobacteria bacterium]|nr:SurA N-terminal domain-containing protein [Deltaproteobacteria bacterium]
MLRLMRKQAGSWVIKILLGAIVIVFVFWGVGSFRSQRGGRVALVNGDQITLDEYREAYNNLIEQLRRRFGNNLNEDMLKQLQVKRQALNQLIDNKLLIQEAKRLKFRVSEKELADAISNFTAFQRAGMFDRNLYANVLDRLRMTPEVFEAAQKDAMLIDKLRTLITSSAKISDQEALEWYNWINASVNIDYVFFDPNHYKDIHPSDEEIKTFFENHKEKYKTDAMAKARYLHFNPDAFRSKIVLSDEEVREYYDDNLETFKTPKTVEARHILLKVNRDADPETVKKTKDRALNILKLAKEGKDFAELAKQYSEGPTRNNGGYLGKFKRDAMVKPFSDMAFSLKAGEISEPVRTRFGWHLIKVEKVNEASVTSFDDAKKDIRKKLTDDMAKRLAYDEAEAVSDDVFEGEDLINAAKERNMTILTTDFFSSKGPIKGINNPSEFASVAFNLTDKEISNVQEFENGYYILQLVDKIQPEIPEFDMVKEKVKLELIKEKQDEKAKADSETLLAALKNGKTMPTESKKFNLTPKTTGFFKRSGSIPEIGFERDITEVAFQLTDKKPFPENVLKGSKGYYVIQFKDRKISAPENFSKEKEDIKNRLLAQKKSGIFDALLAQIKSRSEITIKEGFLD